MMSDLCMGSLSPGGGEEDLMGDFDVYSFYRI